MLLPLLLLVGYRTSSATRFRCGQEITPEPWKYHFATPCTRSKMSIIGSTFSSTLEHCMQFAARRKALAINFAHTEFLHSSVTNFSGVTCLAFDCPELDVQLSLEIDTVYDYYTTYARPMPNNNVTCLPRLGVFHVHQKRMNYTQAQKMCEMEDGNLADLSNGPRSAHLGASLSQLRLKIAFIGLAMEEGTFLTSTNVPLDCLPYRGWAPGEPRKGRECVALTTTGLWSTQQCSMKLPFICELKPSGPLKPCLYVEPDMQRTCRKKFRNSFPSLRRTPSCGDPIINETTFKLPPPQEEIRKNILSNINSPHN